MSGDPTAIRIELDRQVSLLSEEELAEYKVNSAKYQEYCAVEGAMTAARQVLVWHRNVLTAEEISQIEAITARLEARYAEIPRPRWDTTGPKYPSTLKSMFDRSLIFALQKVQEGANERN